jgi:hypothetical protein
MKTKTKIVPLILLCLAVPGCEDMLNEENGKTEAELRAERNRPIYEQFIGEWDDYLDDTYSTLILSPGFIATGADFIIRNGSKESYKTDINYTDLIYTLEEFQRVIDYDGGVGSDDLTKDGFIKFKWGSEFEYHKYHFYDENKFSLKHVTTHTGTPRKLVLVDGVTLYCKSKNITGGPGDSVDLPGDYGLTVGSYNCTLTFHDDGTYVFDHPVGSDRSGTWTQTGGEVTMTYTVQGSQTISEVFTTTEDGDVVLLTLKDSSVSVSNILASFNLVANSVSLTRN